MISFEDVTLITRLDKCKELKEVAKDQFQQKEFDKALVTYNEAISALNPERDFFDEEKENPKQIQEMKELKSIIYSNMATILLAQKKYPDAHDVACESIKYDSSKNNFKSFFRKGLALFKQGQLKEAEEEFSKLFAFNDPQISSLVVQGIEKAKKELKEEESKKGEDMQKMLGQLKDIGNSLLGKIGISLDNFKVNKDDKSGGYSISFQK